jgi:anti-sigma factor RsiW
MGDGAVPVAEFVMTWNCEHIEARLSDYLDGLLTPEERHAFDVHANSCESCGQMVASISQMVTGLHVMEQIETPPQLVYAILNKTLGPRTAKKGWSNFGWLRGLTTARFAYSAVSVAATLLILLVASGVSLSKPKLADFSPVNLYRGADSQVHRAYARTTKFVSDLRVVYEIQSRLNKDNNELPTTPESTVPQSSPGKSPGTTDRTHPATPRQQNRADGPGKNLEILAVQIPVLVGSQWFGQLLGRRIR